MKIEKMIKIVALLAVIGLTGCSVNPSKIDDKDAGEFVKKITYVQDKRTGICFAILASRKTADTDQNGLGLTYVPCDKVPQGLLVQ